MASDSRDTLGYQNYQNVHLADSSRAHLGNVYYYGQSSDERAFNAILESLSYLGMTDRRDALAEAHEGTFDWTFLEGETDFLSHRKILKSGEHYDAVHTVNMNFGPWLRDESGGLFCFTGKPGSGKSTFMYVLELSSSDLASQYQAYQMSRKSLASSVDVEKALQTWSKDKPLVRAEHYFWILGGPMQKSVEGLLKNLLHSVLCTLSRLKTSECHAVVKEVCGPRWTSMNNRAPWNRGELKRVLSRLGSVLTTKCFVLIDALDECEPQNALSVLADEILWMSQLSNVKLCVSCRPWNVFVQKFDHAASLNIDMLTYCGMAKYIEERLVDAEAQCIFQDDFCTGTQAAKELVYHVADAAEGVFLWTELVTKALCSELRKGRNITQLHQIVREFPADLDNYFDKLIFNRIGRTRRNIRDTAAALKLALELHRNEKRGDSCLNEFTFPMSFMNFWLLRQGHLHVGFSWNDHESVTRYPVNHMMKELRSFLEETCKDLLVPVKTTSTDGDPMWNINFLHRTVYDYLSDSDVNISLERDAPEHFSDPEFIAELARLRCLCLLHQTPFDCQLTSNVFCDILRSRLPSTPRDRFPNWITTCESSMITQMQAHCVCLGSHYLLTGNMAGLCARAGLNWYPLKAMKHLPHLALLMATTIMKNPLAIPLESSAIVECQTTNVTSLHLLRIALACGCDPNKFSEKSVGRISCRRTCWEVWLAETYWWLSHDVRNRNTRRQKRAIGVIISLLLEHNADPNLMLCVEDHEWPTQHASSGEQMPCRRLTLCDLLPLLVLPESFAEVSNLWAACSEATKMPTVKRKQCQRAVKSLIISEHNVMRRVVDEGQHSMPRRLLEEYWEREQRKFLLTLTDQENTVHDTWCCCCARRMIKKLLFTWCIDCRDISFLCDECSKVFSSETRSFEPPCKVPQSSDEADIGGHTSIIVSYDALFPAIKARDEKLASRYSIARAITVLKEWYAGNPI